MLVVFVEIDRSCPRVRVVNVDNGETGGSCSRSVRLVRLPEMGEVERGRSVMGLTGEFVVCWFWMRLVGVLRAEAG